MNQARRETPVLKRRPSPETAPPEERRLNWQGFTEDAVLAHEPELAKREQVVMKALKASSWKTAGPILFLGVVGWNEELWLAGEHVAQVVDRHVDAYDDFTAIPDSFLQSDRLSPVPHLRTPPTIHPRVQVFKGWPDFDGETHPVVFCCIAPGRWRPLEALRSTMLEGAVIVGTHADLRELARSRALKYVVVCRCGLTLAVRVLA